MNTDESEKLEKIKRRLLHLFADSLGWEFRVKGSPLTDIIEGVDFKLQMVKGKRYGDFAVDLCELTGKNPEDLSAEQLLN